ENGPVDAEPASPASCMPTPEVAPAGRATTDWDCAAESRVMQARRMSSSIADTRRSVKLLDFPFGSCHTKGTPFYPYQCSIDEVHALRSNFHSAVLPAGRGLSRRRALILH